MEQSEEKSSTTKHAHEIINYRARVDWEGGNGNKIHPDLTV